MGVPATVAGYADTDAIAPGTVYANESVLVQASDQVQMTGSSYADIPGLTVSLTLARPSGVLQIAQVDFLRGVAFASYGVQLVCVGHPDSPKAVTRVPRFSGVWQNLFVVMFWGDLAAGTYTFKVQGTQATVKNRKNCLIVMRI